MPLFSKPICRKLLDALLVNAYTVMPVGFFDGKAGIALTLFETAGLLTDERVENHAFNLLQEVLAHQTPCNNFNYGKAGIAFVLDYLIAGNLLSADYDDLYRSEQDRIVEEIEGLEYRKEDGFLYIDYFFFIHALAHRLPEEAITRCGSLLAGYIRKFYGEKFGPEASRLFYFSASKFFSVCNAADVSLSVRADIVRLILEKEKELREQDLICEDVLFPVKKNLYETLHRSEKRNGPEATRPENPTGDIVVPCLNIKEKVSLIYDIYRLYASDPSHDYRPVAERIKASLVAADETEQKRRLLAALPLRNEQTLGIGTGLSRLVLLHLYLDTIEQGIFPEKLTRLWV